MRDLDAIIFDVGGVIVAHDNTRLFATLAAACRDATHETIAGLFAERGYDTGRLPISHLHQRLRDELGYARDWPGFKADWCCHFEIDGQMLALLRRLAEDRRVILFSNTNHEHWTHLLSETQGELGAYEAYLSHELGLAKPAPEAFRKVLALAGLEPPRALFVDDRADNVAAAEAVGLRGHHFRRHDDLVAALAPA